MLGRSTTDWSGGWHCPAPAESCPSRGRPPSELLQLSGPPQPPCGAARDTPPARAPTVRKSAVRAAATTCHASVPSHDGHREVGSEHPAYG